MTNFLQSLTAAEEIGQAPFDPGILWVVFAGLVGAAIIGLVVWKSVTGWREKIADKRAETALSEAKDKAAQTAPGAGETQKAITPEQSSQGAKQR